MSRRSRSTPRRVAIIGAGKVGHALARGLLRAGVPRRLIPARRLRAAELRADVVWIAVRDPDVASISALIAPHVGQGTIVLHCAGGLGLEPLATALAAGAQVGSAHPLLAFADPARPPTLAGGALVLAGGPRAVTTGRWLARALGMRPIPAGSVDRTAYHAAVALAANGASTLAAVSAELLSRAGVPERDLRHLLGPLLGSVAANVAALGPFRALTGPVRRGDVEAVQRHLAAVQALDPSVERLYRDLVRVQIRLAEKLGDAPAGALARLLDHL